MISDFAFWNINLINNNIIFVINNGIFLDLRSEMRFLNKEWLLLQLLPLFNDEALILDFYYNTAEKFNTSPNDNHYTLV